MVSLKRLLMIFFRAVEEGVGRLSGKGDYIPNMNNALGIVQAQRLAHLQAQRAVKSLPCITTSL
jgi:hypothetical protein